MKLTTLFALSLCGALVFTACEDITGGSKSRDEELNPDQPAVPVLKLTPSPPLSGSPLLAGFTIDGKSPEGTVTYLWERSADRNAWEPRPENGPELVPWTEDVGDYFRVTVSHDGTDYQAVSGKTADYLYTLIRQTIAVDLMSPETDGTDLTITLSEEDGLSYQVTVNGTSNMNVTKTFKLSEVTGGVLTPNDEYTVSITAEKEYGNNRTLSIIAPYEFVVTPRQAFSTFSGTGINGASITEPYGNPQYKGGNSIKVGDSVYAVTTGQYSRLNDWLRNNTPEVRSLFNLNITGGEFAADVTLTGEVQSISLYGFNEDKQTVYTPDGFTVGALGIYDGAVLELPDDLDGKLVFTAASPRIYVAPGGELRNRAKMSPQSASPWTPGLETVSWTFRHGSTVYTQGYVDGNSQAFIATSGSGIDSTAVWETGSASNESSLNLSPGTPNRRPLVKIDGKTTFIRPFTAFSDWDIKEGSKITVAMANSADVFDFSNGVAPDETDETETAKRWQLIGHTGPLPIANSYFRVDCGRLIALKGIEDKEWNGVTTFRWYGGQWRKE